MYLRDCETLGFTNKIIFPVLVSFVELLFGTALVLWRFLLNCFSFPTLNPQNAWEMSDLGEGCLSWFSPSFHLLSHNERNIIDWHCNFPGSWDSDQGKLNRLSQMVWFDCSGFSGTVICLTQKVSRLLEFLSNFLLCLCALYDYGQILLSKCWHFIL